MKKILFNSILVLIVLVIGSCEKDLPNQPKPNQPPTTRLWLASPDTLRETSSRLSAYWYGEDPDGYVKGFLIAVAESTSASSVAFPDTFSYIWTTRNDSIIALPLLKQRSLFTIIARSVDNTFKEHAAVHEGSVVRLMPQPYVDNNVNGIYDVSDVLLSSLFSSIDKKSAKQLLPIRNTPPNVFFAVNPIDSTIIQQPDTTFTVATFSWYGQDVDGNNTISGYRIALNDTSSSSRWLNLTNSATTITLMVPRTASDPVSGDVEADVYTGTYPTLQFRGKVPGLRLNNDNVLILQARDVAGEYSTATKMPSTTTRKWYVKKPQSRMLFVLDYGVTNNTEKNAVVPYYRNILSNNSILAGSLKQFDVLDIVNSQPSFLNPALIKTLQLYTVVIWATNRFPSIVPSQIGLFNYTQSGGKVIFTTTFASAISYAELKALNDFAPIDSTTSDTTYVPGYIPLTNADRSLLARTSVTSLISGYPPLTVDTVGITSPSQVSSHGVNMRRIYKRTDSKYIYRLDSSRSTPPRYIGSPDIACIDNDKKFLLFALPLHLLNGNPKNLPLFFKHVIENEFGLN